MASDEKSWKIDGESISPDLQLLLRKSLQTMQDSLDALPRPLAPPWQVFPDHARTSMGWRMGAGETYLDYFRDLFSTLSAEDRQAYISATPIPDEWAGWLEAIHA